MILCCKTCGTHFNSHDKQIQCTYCNGEIELLISDMELETMASNDLPTIIEATKEKYKFASNPNYNNELWKAREEKDSALASIKADKQRIENLNNHQTTTGYNFEGYQIVKYIKVISGNVALGTGFLSELSLSANGTSVIIE